MTTLALQSARYDELRAIGATPAEAIMVMTAEAEVAQVIDLAAWEHELRDAHGRFSKTGAAARSPRASSAEAHRIMQAQAKARSAIAAPAESAASRTHVTAEEAQQIANIAITKAHGLHMKQILAEAHHANEQFHKAREAQGESANRKRLTKALAVHGSLIATGGMIAWIESRLGVAGIVQIASAMSPQLLQEVVDKFGGTG